VWRVGRLWLCRSCSLLYGAAALTAGSAILLRPTASLVTWLFGLVAVPVVLLSFPPLYRALARRARDLLRAATGFLLGLALAWVFVGVWWAGVLILAAFFVLLRLYLPFRRRQRHALCAGCPELGRAGVCSGYRRQAVRIRRYEDEATAALEARLLGRDAAPL
jgi:hypothetical protein